MYYYWAYGLSIESEIEFPELLPFKNEGKSDVKIVLGDTPSFTVSENDFVTDEIIITPVAFKLTVKGIASYVAKDGNLIIVEPMLGYDQSTMRLFCLSNVFAALLQQRRLVPLHCAAIVIKGRLALFFGSSGSGKSTTLISMIKRGFVPFSDDVCVPFLNDMDDVFCFSSYPMIKSWHTKIDMGILQQLGEGHRLRPELDKLGYYFHDRFDTSPMKPEIVFFLERVSDLESVYIEKVQGVDRFMKLDEHVYRSEFLRFSSMQKEHFKILSALAKQSDFYLLRRGEDETCIDLVADLIDFKLRHQFEN